MDRYGVVIFISEGDYIEFEILARSAGRVDTNTILA